MVEQAESSGGSQSLTKSTIKNSNVGKSRTQKNPIAESFRTVERQQLDVLIVRALCANGIPFNVLRNPDFTNMIKALSNAPSDYKPPSFDRSRTSVLDEVYRQVDNLSDGWTNVKGEPLINVIASNNRGSMFMYADDFSGQEKTGKNIANYLLKSIDEIGPSNVLQVVTDNAANCKAAGKEIEKVHKHIFWSPCVVHTTNLIFKDFDSSFGWMSETYKKGKEIVKYFKHHQNASSAFSRHSDLESLKVAKTRFGSHHLLLERLLKCRDALAITVVQRGCKDWIKGDEELGRRVAANINDSDFWDEVQNVLKITKPLYMMIKFSDGEGQKMGEVYEKMDCMIGEMKDIVNNNTHAGDWDKMEDILVSRWEKMNIPLHCLGFALNPHFYDANYLKTPAPGGLPRRPPNADREVVNGVLKAFDKIGEDAAEKTLLRQQLSAFQSREGIFGTREAIADAIIMNPISWWNAYGSETPELADIAVRVLSQPISSSSAEKVWSTYSFIHNTKRNRLNGARADKLVFIHSNIRLLSRYTTSYNQGPSKKWDINPESDYLDDSLVRLEELRCG
ncbi:uncharacterized protein LOC141639034 [Silene latifolia]|uniref:uncharacterized protein LOC141639034 n=1 Tax=Silene latifolia TaxID=37657 RepID=UPI003D76D694